MQRFRENAILLSPHLLCYLDTVIWYILHIIYVSTAFPPDYRARLC